MSVLDVAVSVLMVVAVASVALSCIGMLATRSPWDQLHFTGPATIVAPVALAVAIVVEEPISSAAVKAVLVAMVMLVTGPVILHATARAARVRDQGRFVILAHEAEKREHPSRRSRR